MRKKLQELLAEYGPVAAVIYFSIFFLVLGSFGLAIQLGFELEGAISFLSKLGLNRDSVAATAGSWTAAYVLTKVTQPLRIAATLALTPVVGKAWKRLRRPRPAP